MLTSISAPQITSTAPKVKVPTRRSRAGRDPAPAQGCHHGGPPLPSGAFPAAERLMQRLPSCPPDRRRRTPAALSRRRKRGGSSSSMGVLVLGAPDKPQAQQDHQHGDDQAGQAIAQQSVEPFPRTIRRRDRPAGSTVCRRAYRRQLPPAPADETVTLARSSPSRLAVHIGQAEEEGVLRRGAGGPAGSGAHSCRKKGLQPDHRQKQQRQCPQKEIGGGKKDQAEGQQ